MRDIKFRAWNKEKNIMCYRNEDLDADYWDGVYASILEIINDNIKAKRYIFMQYTGLHDKNEKEIYEGDIVQILGGEYEQGFYEWDEKVQIKDLIYDGFNLMMTISQIGNQAIEIIGNIYENPELLEDK